MKALNQSSRAAFGERGTSGEVVGGDCAAGSEGSRGFGEEAIQVHVVQGAGGGDEVKGVVGKGQRFGVADQKMRVRGEAAGVAEHEFDGVHAEGPGREFLQGTGGEARAATDVQRCLQFGLLRQGGPQFVHVGQGPGVKTIIRAALFDSMEGSRARLPPTSQ